MANYCSIKRNGKYYKRSRFNMEKQLGRKLAKNEIVHHKDGDRLNDDIDNLEVMDCRKHNI